jgi:predicted neuraminidase
LAHLEIEPGEYSYPAIVKTSKGVAISYTWRRERIRSWQIPQAMLNDAVGFMKTAQPALPAPEPAGPIVYR